MAITIPKEHASGLARILSLSSEENQRVIAALTQAKSLNSKDLTVLVAAALPSLSAAEIAEIIGTLVSLFSARTGIDIPLSQFVTELLLAAKPATSGIAVEELKENMGALLSVRPLSMLAKARGVHTDYENTFCSVRILTDLRPVFDNDVKKEPVGFVMAHLLKIGYHHAGRHTNIHIAMDAIDIDSLMQALERAKDKATTLSGVTGRCGYPMLAE